jgi:hypothetical protein|nr:MAG TPA: hypothetical protein [Caudoviricetes sp.]
MSQAIILKGGTGGVTSEDVTASKAQVLQGYKTVTTDSDDEIIEGTMVNRGNGMDAVEFVDAYWDSKYLARMEQGFYLQNGIWKPYVGISYAVLANGIHLDANKMLDTLQVSGVRGKIKGIDTGANNFRANKSNAYGIDNWTDVNNPTFYIDLPYGNAFYNRSDGHPHVCIDAEKLGNATADRVVAGSAFTSKNGVAVQGQIADRGEGGVVSFAQGREDWANRMWVTFKNGWYHRAPHPQGHESYVYITYEQLKNLFGIDASKMLQGHDVAGVQGTIPRWICTTGDVITALGGEGFVWDDTHASRGRGIVVKVPNGRYIQGANWVFLPSPNLQPWNVRQNVNVNGVVGTMVDYGAGGQAFRAATFDGRLLTGVANKGFVLRGIGRYLNLKNINYGYQGIVDGGLKFINGFSENTRFKSAPYIGCVFANSVNLTPFRLIKFGFKVFTFRGDGTGSQPARIELEVGATSISSAGGETYHNESNTVVRDIGGWSKSATYTMTSTKSRVGNQSDMSQQYLTLDVSERQGHHFVYIMLGNIVHEYSIGSVYAEVVVNYIEFIN